MNHVSDKSSLDTTNQVAQSRKIIPLESMRGIAAFMVFLFHFVLGFMPQRHGQEATTAIPGGNLLETPFSFDKWACSGHFFLRVVRLCFIL